MCKIFLHYKQAELLSYETGEKAAEVELLKERVQLLEEEVKVQEGKASEAQCEVEKLKKEGQCCLLVTEGFH